MNKSLDWRKEVVAMEYVLIFQLPGSSKDDFDELIELEESVRDCIGDLGTVDGHDIGSGERNIFIFTEQPETAFLALKSVFESKRVVTNLKVAYREVEGREYTALYPPGLRNFAVIGDE
jgi:hypothetical protein